MKTIRLTMAQALVKFLDNQYVEFNGKQEKFIKGFFTIFGHGNVVGLGQALEEYEGDMIVHQGRNEQGMAQAAIGFAKQTHRKQIYACTSSVGPGAANMVTAAATATANRIPVLLLPGDTFATRQPDPVLQQVEQSNDLSITTNDAFKSVSKYWDRINRPEQLMTAAINAIRVLVDPADTGAVTLSLPQDVQGEAYDYPESFFQKRVHRIERTPATAEMLKDAVELMKNKKKPLLIAGGGVRYSEAAAVVKEFSKKFNIPYAETQAGKSGNTWDDKYNLGTIGVTGTEAANVIAQNCDLIIGVGTKFNDFVTGSKWLFADKEVLQININCYDAYKLDAVKVVADAKAGLEALAAELEKIGYKSGYTDEIDTVKEKWEIEWQRLANVKYCPEGFVPEIPGQLDHVLKEVAEQTGSCLTVTEVLGALNDLLDDDAIVVAAAGSLPADLGRMWKCKTPNVYNMEYGYSCMGYEVPAALGAKIAAPDQEVYAMVGDGSYMMLHSELPTAIQEGKKINVIMFDNMAFGCINNLQMGAGIGSFGTEFRRRNPKTGKLDGSLVPVDFAMNARSYGAVGYTVKNMDELKAAVEDSKKQETSTLIDIKVLPKTMTHHYETFWSFGCAEVAKNKKVEETAKELKETLKKARQY